MFKKKNSSQDFTNEIKNEKIKIKKFLCMRDQSSSEEHTKQL